MKKICPLHGEFTNECKKCKINTQFIEKAKLVHGDKYDYSKVVYSNSHSMIIIICKIHGEFKIRPYAHTNQKQGCYKCGIENRIIPHKKTTNHFINQCKDKWGNKYDYSITKYERKSTKIKYICLIHGEQEQLPKSHLNSGCQFCNGRGKSKHSKLSFVNIANAIHYNKYDYTHTDFQRMTDEITITCPKHGEFTQRAGNHIHLRNGCPKCAIPSSKPEKEVFDFISNNYKNEILQNVRILDGKEIDIYLPKLKIGIEYHGIFWHLETIVGKKYHYEKFLKAKKIDVQLIQIYSNEWENKKDIIKSKLLNMLGKSNKIYARKTQLIELNNHEKNEFLTKNHIQGPDSSKICYALTYQNEIISCMTLGPSRFNKNYDFELMRFCNKINVSVIGGASKLLSHFTKSHKGSIITYADKRYSNGNLYKQIGFTLDGETKPSFSVFNIKTKQLHSRLSYRRKHLKKLPHYNDSLKCYEIMQLNNLDRIWDAGQYRFVIKNSH